MSANADADSPFRGWRTASECIRGESFIFFEGEGSTPPKAPLQALHINNVFGPG